MRVKQWEITIRDWLIKIFFEPSQNLTIPDGTKNSWQIFDACYKYSEPNNTR
jgi:hypothetical protein